MVDGLKLMQITDTYMTAMAQNTVEVRSLSETCHASHREVSTDTRTSLDANTLELGRLREQSHDTELAIRGVTAVLTRMNGGAR